MLVAIATGTGTMIMYLSFSVITRFNSPFHSQVCKST